MEDAQRRLGARGVDEGRVRKEGGKKFFVFLVVVVVVTRREINFILVSLSFLPCFQILSLSP